MELMRVQSTNINAVGYDEQSASMQIQFKNGDVYAYSNIAPDVYAGMLANPGTYFASIIKPQRMTMPFVKLGNLPLA